MGNQEWTIQIAWQHMGHKTLDEDKKNIQLQISKK
jgi:hypothetical protein